MGDLPHTRPCLPIRDRWALHCLKLPFSRSLYLHHSRYYVLVILKVSEIFRFHFLISNTKILPVQEMAKSACRPLRSSVYSFDRDLFIPQSNSSTIQLRQLQQGTSSHMPATFDFSHPRSADYCFGAINQDTGLMSGSRTFPSWPNVETQSNHSRLPRLFHNRYGSTNGDLHDPVEGSIAEKSAKPSPCWEPEDIPQPSYTPNPHNSCQYTGLHNIEGGNNHWNIPNYSFGYPTPQSESSLSPPQRAYGEFPLLSFQDSSGLPVAEEEVEGLSSFDRHFPSPDEPQHPCGQDGGGQRADNGNDEIDEGGGVNSEPYAQLIFRALKSAPGYRMVLKDIYHWFEKHTNKATGGSKGWQNSIRHNLSMNGVSLPLPYK